MNSFTTKLPDILFVRHGQTDWNRTGRMQGQRDIPLNELGRRQAERNGRVLSGLIGRGNWQVVHSPLGRARETMEIILECGVASRHIRHDDRLKEIAYGEFEGLTPREIRFAFADLIAARKKDKWNFPTPGGESYAELSIRTWTFLEALREPTLIVAHGGLMRVILQRLLNIPETEALALQPPQNRILSIVRSGPAFL